ncbi:hypothetical protein COY05_04930 [Candidatus Peregrinibacteria bacterium CG_4_10_14_0_2_um_filter_38_24]|nr:MAG: hypothetical protein COY05_04930 [Candidatus Peregrinibacteria bacterium CG_4_10_14_0_2_um_filter_38_24]
MITLIKPEKKGPKTKTKMAIKKFLDCISNYSQKLSQKENRFVYFAEAEKPAPAETEKEPKDMNHEEFTNYLKDKTKVSIEGTNPNQKFVFTKGKDSGSFPWTQTFENKLKALNTPAEITTAVKEEFKRITKENSRTEQARTSNEPAKELDTKKEPVELPREAQKIFEATIKKAEETRAKAKKAYDKIATANKSSASDPTLTLSSITEALASAKTAFEAKTKKIKTYNQVDSFGKSLSKTEQGTFGTNNNLTNGRTIDENGTVEQGEFDSTNGRLKGQRINSMGTISEGEFQSGNLQKGRTILTSGVILQGEFDEKGFITKYIKIDQNGNITKIPAETTPAPTPSSVSANAPTAAAAQPPTAKEPELTQEYKAKHEQTLKKATATRAKAETTIANSNEVLKKAKAQLTPLTPDVQTAIDDANKAADNSSSKDALKGKTYSENATTNPHRTEIGERTNNKLTKGRTIDRKGNILEGNFDPTSKQALIKGRAILQDGTIFEGTFDPTIRNLTEGRSILPDGTIFEGTFDPTIRNLTEGRSILPDGTIIEGTFDPKKNQLTTGTKTLTNGEVKTWKNGTAEEAAAAAQPPAAPASAPTAAAAQPPAAPASAPAAAAAQPPAAPASAPAAAAAQPPDAVTAPPAKPESKPEVTTENEVVKNAGNVADAAAIVADEAAKKAATAGERTPKAGERTAIYRNKKGTLFTGIVNDQNELVEGTAVTPKNTKFEGLIDPKTKQIIFGRITLKTGEKFEGEFHPAKGEKAAQLKEGRHVSADGNTTEEGLFDKDSSKLQEGRRITTVDGKKQIEVGKFDKTTEVLTEGRKTFPDGHSETGKWDSKGESDKTNIKTAAPAKAPEAKPKSLPLQTAIDKLSTKTKKGIVITPEALADTTKPDTREISTETLNKIEKTSQEIIDAIKKGRNLLEITDKLWELRQTLKTECESTPIKEISFILDPEKRKLSWKKDPPPALGFGNIVPEIEEKILEIKKNTLSGEEYQEFIQATETARKDRKEQEKERKKETKYFNEITRITSSSIPIDESVYKLKEEGITQNWDNMRGHRKIEQIMTAGPFNLQREAVGKTVSAMITEDLDFKMYFSDIFKFMEGFLGLKGTSIDPKLLKDSSEFVEKYKELIAKPSLTPAEDKLVQEMRDKVYIPCARLLEAIQNLKYISKEKKKEERFDEDKKEVIFTSEQAELPETQKKIRKNLYTLCYFENREISAYDKIMGWFADAQDTITMADIDGKTRVIDKGLFRSHSDPQAAIHDIYNRKELYTFNEKGQKIFDETKVLAYVNRIIRLGIINFAMARELKKNPKAEDIKKIDTSKHEIKKLEDISSLLPEQKDAFQFGFVVDQLGHAADTIKKGKEAIAELAKYDPRFEEIGKQLEKNGVPKKQILEIQSTSIAGLAGNYDRTTGKYVFGVGAGTRMALSENWSFSAGGGINTKGDGVVGVALDYKLWKGNVPFTNKQWEGHAGASIDSSGINVAASATIKFDKPINLTAFAGARLSFSDLKNPGFGAGLVFSWDAQRQFQQDLKKSEAKYGLEGDNWEKWKEMSKEDIEGRHEALKKMPRIWTSVGKLETDYSLTHEDIVHMMDSLSSEITRGTLQSVSSPLGIICAAGIAASIGGPTGFSFGAILGITIGSSEYVIQNRRESARMLSEMSQGRTKVAFRRAIKESALNQIGTSESSTADLRSISSSVISGRDGVLMARSGEKKADLAAVKDHFTRTKDARTKAFTAASSPAIAEYNTILAESELKLVETTEADSKKKIQLVILNPDGKDIEINIDPLMKRFDPTKNTGVSVVFSDGKLFVEGDLSLLAISRERFILPFNGSPGSASIRDIITIGDEDSVRGGRNREWIQKNSNYLQQLHGESKFYLMEENTAEAGEERQENLRKEKDYKGFTPLETDRKKEKTTIKTSLEAAKRQEKDIEEQQTAYTEMQAAITAIQKTAYEKLTRRISLKTDLETLMKDKNFLNSFEKILSDNQKIAALVKSKIKPDLNLKEINFALSYLPHLWFSPVNLKRFNKPERRKRRKGPKKTPETPNEKIYKYMHIRIGFEKREVLIPMFAKKLKESGLNKGNEQKEAERLAEILVQNIFAELDKKLLDKDNPFNLTELQASAEKVPPETIFASGTREYQTVTTKKRTKRERKGAITTTANIEDIGGFGLLKGTIKQYDLNSSDPDEKLIAKLLLEQLSPTTTPDNIEKAEGVAEFLHRPLSLKVASLPSTALLMDKAEYKLLIKLFKNPRVIEEKKAKESYVKALKSFIAWVQEVRESQLSGTPLIKTLPNGLSIRITPKAKVVSGAYSQCANPSWYASEEIEEEILGESETKILGKARRLKAKYAESIEAVNAEESKHFVNIFTAATTTASKKPPETEPKTEIKKNATEGVKTKTSVKAAAKPTPAEMESGGENSN